MVVVVVRFGGCVECGGRGGGAEWDGAPVVHAGGWYRTR